MFESAIDLLSYATILKMRGEDWKKHCYISLGGTAISPQTGLPPALSHFLNSHERPRTIALHLDNDAAGRKYSIKIIEKLDKKYDVVDCPPPQGKDVNDYLLLHSCNKSIDKGDKIK